MDRPGCASAMADCVDRLNVEDVDVEARRIRVRPSITQVGGRLVEGNPKSDAGRRSVLSIPERLVPPLRARLDGHLPGWSGHHLAAGFAIRSGELEAGSQLEI